MIPLSVLDLAPIVEGGNAATSFRNSLDLARHAERLGYRRFWLAEHHNIPSVASAATSVLIAYVAGGTSTIRVGAGGIMLPNHSPLVIAEQFGTLASLFPGRIDLGLGRAPGSDQVTAQALRRSPAAADSESEARRLFTSLQQAFINLRRGRPGPLKPPAEGFEASLAPFERAMLADMLAFSVVGTREQVRAGLEAIVERTGADELMVASQIYDHSARLESYTLAAEAAEIPAVVAETADHR